MAALKHNGTEIGRVVAVKHPDEDGDVWEIQYSVRSNGYILAQMVRRPHTGHVNRMGWKRFGKWGGSGEAAVKMMRQRLATRSDLAEVR